MKLTISGDKRIAGIIFCKLAKKKLIHEKTPEWTRRSAFEKVGILKKKAATNFFRFALLRLGVWDPPRLQRGGRGKSFAPDSYRGTSYAMYPL